MGLGSGIRKKTIPDPGSRCRPGSATLNVTFEVAAMGLYCQILLSFYPVFSTYPFLAGRVMDPSVPPFLQHLSNSSLDRPNPKWFYAEKKDSQ
jgi:hypothetical protein